MNVLPMSKVDKVVDHIELLEEEEREGTFLSLVQTGATCCERKGATVCSISFLVGFMCFSQILKRQRTDHKITSRCSDSNMIPRRGSVR